MANMSKRTSLVGKGDRPRKVDQKKFKDNFDKIFGAKKSESNEKKGS
jgi:hypothetical protein